MTAEEAKKIATDSEYNELLSRIGERAKDGHKLTFILEWPCYENVQKLKDVGFKIKKGPFFLGGVIISWE